MSNYKWDLSFLIASGGLMMLAGLRDLYFPHFLTMSPKSSRLDAGVLLAAGGFFVAVGLFKLFRS